MKKYIYLMLSVVLAGIFGACSKDDPFGNEPAIGATGGFMTASLQVSLESEQGPRSVKNRSVRVAAPSLDDFKVGFFREGVEEAVATYDYRDMPEIVTLPVGKYVAKAYYGDNPEAGWDSPYYEGASNEFTIVEDEILSESQKILCKIANVRVSISFTPGLEAVVDKNDCRVTVEVGDAGTLVFTYADISAGKSGYFRYVNDSQTLAATFSGTVDGVYTTEAKTGVDVQPGRYYAITFRLHDAGEEDPGRLGEHEDGMIIVDASFTNESISGSVNSDEEYLEDDMRPKEDNDEPGKDNPGKDEPVGPEEGSAPTIVAEEPIVLDVPYVYPDDGSGPAVVINVHSEAGIKSFTVGVNMAGVPESELTGMHLASEMDLVNPDPDYKDSLKALGFPVEVGGKNDVKIEISKDLLNLLTALEGTHEFKLKVGDKNGSLEKSLLIKVVK